MSNKANSDSYYSNISKIITHLSKTEKHLTRLIKDLEKCNLESNTDETSYSKLLSMKFDSSIDVLNQFNNMTLNTILTIHNINEIKLKV